MIHWSRYQDKSIMKVIYPVIQDNAYLSPPENLLLYMLVDERTHVREVGLRRVIGARRRNLDHLLGALEVPVGISTRQIKLKQATLTEDVIFFQNLAHFLPMSLGSF